MALQVCVLSGVSRLTRGWVEPDLDGKGLKSDEEAVHFDYLGTCR